MPAIDSLIAATALAHELIIVTRNTKDFEGIGASTVNPWNAAYYRGSRTPGLLSHSWEPMLANHYIPGFFRISIPVGDCFVRILPTVAPLEKPID